MLDGTTPADGNVVVAQVTALLFGKAVFVGVVRQLGGQIVLPASDRRSSPSSLPEESLACWSTQLGHAVEAVPANPTTWDSESIVLTFRRFR